MAVYTSFKDLANTWSQKYNIKKASSMVLQEAALVMRENIQIDHGSSHLKPVTQLTSLIKGGNTPLRETGMKLAGSVKDMVFPGRGLAIITSTNKYLRNLHEMGVYVKMKPGQRRYIFARMNEFGLTSENKVSRGAKGYLRIPPRPIWRRAVSRHRAKVIKQMRKVMKMIFKN